MARKKTAAQLEGRKTTKDSGGFKVLLSDTTVDGPARFAAGYDTFYGMTGVVGYGPSRAAAIADLERAATRYHKQRRDQEWRDYDEDKARRLRDDDY